ncbi:MAG: pilus assembly protein PilM, partial [Planctomycetes bacterium]|nr:pilus assembly protein PilM [Planctomycetota bacterium]
MFKLLGKKVYPIGIDLGSSSLKMVQLMDMEGGLGLAAASREDVPAYLQHHPAAMMEWYVKTIKEKLSEKPFKTKLAVTALPARQVLTQHLRMPKLSSEELRKALPWEAQGKVPFDINRALLRHIVAGEVYDNDSDETKLEVILMAASKQVVDQHLNLVERSKIELEQVNVEPCALVNCFNYLLESSEEQGATMFVDLGHACSKVLVTHGSGIVFCRTISIAAEHLKKVISEKLSVDAIQAEKLYLNLELSQTTKPPVQAEPSGIGIGVSGQSASTSERADSPLA